MKNFAYPLLLLAPFFAFACGDEPADSDTTAVSESGFPEHYWLASDPADAKDVGAACADLTDGATVTVRGVIGGSAKPFVDGLAAFTVVDPALKACVGEGENCKTPWDYCCTDLETIAANSMTIEFRDGDNPLQESLLGVNGLDHLATVAVQGVAERDAQGNVTLVASGVRVLN